MPNWSELFQLHAPILEIVIRGTVMFLSLFVLMRVTGKRESGAHSLTDLLVVVLIAQAAAHGMTGDSGGVGDSILLVATILFWSVALDAVSYRWPAFGRLLKSRPSPLISNGVVNHHALRRELMTHDELLSELRLHGIDDVTVVQRACLEPNGMVSILRKRGQQPDEPHRAYP